MIVIDSIRFLSVNLIDDCDCNHIFDDCDDCDCNRFYGDCRHAWYASSLGSSTCLKSSPWSCYVALFDLIGRQGMGVPTTQSSTMKENPQFQ